MSSVLSNPKKNTENYNGQYVMIVCEGSNPECARVQVSFSYRIAAVRKSTVKCVVNFIPKESLIQPLGTLAMGHSIYHLHWSTEYFGFVYNKCININVQLVSELSSDYIQ